jgi:lysyl-tRNA synthetase class 2
MSENNISRARDPGGDSREPKDAKRLTWIPVMASLLTFLIGISDVLAVFESPTFHAKLHKVNAVVPGTLTNAYRTSDVITGLLLLMLARGLRRRKRRAWQAVVALLVFDIVFHVPMRYPLHFHIISVSTIVAIVLLAVLLYRHADFYAVGDPRTRRTAAGVFVALVVMDFAIGLGYLALGPLAGSYSVTTRLKDVLFELVGVYGPVQWASDPRGDLYHLLTSALGLFTLVVTAYLFFRSARPRARLAAADATKIRELLGQARRPGLPRLLRPARRQERDLVALGQGRHLLPRRGRGDARLGRPARRPGGMARRHRRVHGRGGPARLAARGDGVQRAGGRGVVQGRRPGRA